jgi:hypothetical protein
MRLISILSHLIHPRSWHHGLRVGCLMYETQLRWYKCHRQSAGNTLWLLLLSCKAREHHSQQLSPWMWTQNEQQSTGYHMTRSMNIQDARTLQRVLWFESHWLLILTSYCCVHIYCLQDAWSCSCPSTSSNPHCFQLQQMTWNMASRIGPMHLLLVAAVVAHLCP